MGELWHEVSRCGRILRPHALRVLPSSWSVFIAARKVVPGPFKVLYFTVIEHILTSTHGTVVTRGEDCRSIVLPSHMGVEIMERCLFRCMIPPLVASFDMFLRK